MRENLKLKQSLAETILEPFANQGIEITAPLLWLSQNLGGHLGWVYITIVIDWCSKKLVGYSIDTKSKSEDCLMAVDMALKQPVSKRNQR